MNRQAHTTEASLRAHERSRVIAHFARRLLELAELPSGARVLEITRSDVEELQLADATFDRVLCGFALPSFPRPIGALQAFYRVLRPGGRVAVSTWSADCPFLGWWREVVRPYTLGEPGEPQSACRFDTPIHLVTALQDAGFEDIRAVFEDHEFVYADEEEWWTSLASAGASGDLEHLPDAVKARFKLEMVGKVGFLKQADGIHIPYRALIALGAKPAR